jgi:trk system potassium uptake protein TrkA
MEPALFGPSNVEGDRDETAGLIFASPGWPCCTVLVHVVVVGCGRVGSGLAAVLSAEGHSVAVLDRSARAFRRLPAEVECLRIVGSGFDRDDLERAGAIGADALAAVTAGDNSNILTVRIARETYEIPRVVARIKDPRRAEIYQRLGIPTVATVTWTTDQVRRRLLPESAAAEWSDASGRLSLVERQLPEGWAGRRLADLEEPGRLSLVAVTRAGEPRLDARELLGQEGDVLLVAVLTEAEEVLAERLDGSPSTARPDPQPSARALRRSRRV